MTTYRGVAGNLLRGQKRGSGERKSPSGVQGQSPVWGRSRQKPKTHAKYSTEQSHRLSQIAYCSESDYSLKKFPATRGHAPVCVPPGYATDNIYILKSGCPTARLSDRFAYGRGRQRRNAPIGCGVRSTARPARQHANRAAQRR